MAKTLSISYVTLAKTLAFVALWQSVSTRFSLQFYLSSPKEVCLYLFSGIAGGNLLKHTLTTGTEVVIGLFLGLCAGITLGFLLWYSRLAQQILQPVVSFLQILPIFLFAPLVVLWFGVGLKMKVAIVSLAVSVTVLTQIYEGTKTIRPSEYFVLQTFGASKAQVLRYFIIPATFAWVRVGVLASVQAAILGAVIGEFITANSGLGYHIVRQASLYNSTGVIGGAVMLVILSYSFYWMIDYVLNLNRSSLSFY